MLGEIEELKREVEQLKGNIYNTGTNTGDVTLASPDSGLSLVGQVLALGTPQTCTSATSNAVTGTGHTHTVTSVTVAAHNLLSATHDDTTTATAVRGDIITAQGVNPLWQRLAKGSRYQVLTGGVDEPTYGAVDLAQATAITGLLPLANLAVGAVANQLLVTGATPFAPAYVTATGTGAPVLANTPTLITPVLGVASATSLAITNTTYNHIKMVSRFNIAGQNNLCITNNAYYDPADGFHYEKTGSPASMTVQGDTPYFNFRVAPVGTAGDLISWSADPFYITAAGAATLATSLSVPAIVTASGALTITPAAGSNLNIALSTAGDFAVNTSDLYVDTSTHRVGVRTGAPEYQVEVKGIGNATDGLFINTSDYTNIPNAGSISNKFVLNARGLNFTSDGAILSRSVSAGIGIAIDRSNFAALEVNNASGYSAIFEVGNVGVGTITPRKLTDFLSTSQSQLRLSYTDNSVYADFTVGSGGNLTVAPTGDFVFDPTGNDILPNTGYDLNIGSLSKKYLTLHAAELWVETLVAQNTLATIGGRVLIGPTTVLTSDLAAGATTIYVKHNEMASGDRVVMEANGYVEFMSIDSAPGGAGPYSYTVTRDLDGSGSNDWYAGDAIFNTGTTGEGFIDLYSIHGVKEATDYGPAIVGNVRASTTYNDWAEHWAVGNLNGIYGYGVTTYGAAFGKYAASSAWTSVDATNGFRVNYGASLVLGKWDMSGNITIGDVSSDNLYLTSGHVQLRNATTVYTDLAAGVLTIGEVGASKANVLITAGKIEVRNNTTDVIVFDTTESRIDNVLKMSGASAAIAIGATPPTSASAGTGIWIDRTGMYGLAANVLQAKFDAATGAITAGAGLVTLGVNGICLDASQILEPTKIAWQLSGTNKIWIDGSCVSASSSELLLASQAQAGTTEAFIYLSSTRDTSAPTKFAQIRVLGSTSGNSNIRFNLDATTELQVNTGYISITTDARIGGGLYVGATNVDPAPGTITATGNLVINTSDLYVDTSTHFVGVGTNVPGRKLSIASPNSTITQVQGQWEAVDDGVTSTFMYGAGETTSVRAGMQIIKDASNPTNATLLFQTFWGGVGSVTALTMNQYREITIPGLAGVGNRAVMADSNGKLYC